MKKLLLSLALAMILMGTIHAHKVWPYPMTFVQSNGDTITVRMYGDDEFCWYTDMQGNILERNGDDFRIVSTNPETYLANARRMTRAAAIRREPVAQSPSLFPHTGSPKVAVILAEFQDRKFSITNPRVSFDQYLNKTDASPVNFGHYENRNYASVKKYFMDQSNGKFSPQFDIYGPITLPQNMAYYGGTDSNGRDEKYIQLLKDACAAVDDSVNFAQYDQDNDGKIDLVYVIYAGYGQSSGAPVETMWPKRFGGFSEPKYDNKGVNQGGISNELLGKEGFLGYNLTETNQTESFETAIKAINGIGLFCHEFSHCLGLPDFYPTAGGYNNNQGMEDWSVMDNGCYVHYGYYPTAYTAWEREAMGWDNIPSITEAKQYKLDGQVSGGTNAVKIVNPANNKEYYVLQFFEDTKWNSHIARYVNSNKGIHFDPETKGLLIYHVDYDASKFSLSSNTPNNDKMHPRMTVIPADGTLVSSQKMTGLEYAKEVNGDIFASDDTHTVKTFIQTNGMPNAAWWTTTTATPIYNINYKDGAVYFDFRQEFATTGIDSGLNLNANKYNEKIYTIDGRYVGTSTENLPRGIYIKGGKKFVK